MRNTRFKCRSRDSTDPVCTEDAARFFEFSEQLDLQGRVHTSAWMFWTGHRPVLTLGRRDREAWERVQRKVAANDDDVDWASGAGTLALPVCSGPSSTVANHYAVVLSHIVAGSYAVTRVVPVEGAQCRRVVVHPEGVGVSCQCDEFVVRRNLCDHIFSVLKFAATNLLTGHEAKQPKQFAAAVVRLIGATPWRGCPKTAAVSQNIVRRERERVLAAGLNADARHGLVESDRDVVAALRGDPAIDDDLLLNALHLKDFRFGGAGTGAAAGVAAAGGAAAAGAAAGGAAAGGAAAGPAAAGGGAAAGPAAAGGGAAGPAEAGGAGAAAAGTGKKCTYCFAKRNHLVVPLKGHICECLECGNTRFHPRAGRKAREGDCTCIDNGAAAGRGHRPPALPPRTRAPAN